MPTLKIRNIHDASRIVDRYCLKLIPDLTSEGPYGWTWYDFGNWLFVRTNSVRTEELAGYIAEFKQAHKNFKSMDPTFSDMAQLNADTTMEGVLVYEREANDLMMLMRELSGTARGLETLEYISQAAISKCMFSYLGELEKKQIALADVALQRIAALGLETVGPEHYSPGCDPETDRFVAIDICLLGETLANESLWRDDEEFTWPLEVYALVRCAQEFVLATIELRAKKAAAGRNLAESS